MKRNNQWICILLTAMCISLSFDAFPVFGAAVKDSGDKVEVHEKSLQDVLKIVSQRSGYEILMVGDSGKKKITGVFYLSDLESSLRRIFKGTNTFVEFYDNEKRIIVKLPGDSVVVKFSGESKHVVDADQIDPDTGLTYLELIEMRKREREEQLARMSNPASLDPDTGIPYQEQLLTRELEESEHMERVANPGEIDPTTGISYSQQKALLEREKEERKARMGNPEEIDPSTGITYVEQKNIRERERNEMVARTSDPNEIDPESGMTYGELMAIREREKK